MSKQREEELIKLCENHEVRAVEEVLDGYPSLNTELDKCIEKGVTKIELASGRGRIKPAIVMGDDHIAILYANF